MTSLSANFTQGQATFAFRDVIDHCVSRRGSSSYAINWIQESCVFKNQTLKLKREISSRHFDVTELALRARLQERFPKGTRNKSFFGLRYDSRYGEGHLFFFGKFIQTEMG